MDSLILFSNNFYLCLSANLVLLEFSFSDHQKIIKDFKAILDVRLWEHQQSH